MKNIAYFISPHGFGHAARACAVIQAAQATLPGLHFHLYTTVPEWFFQNSLESNWSYHSILCDIGLVQKTAFHEDIDATLGKLKRFLPFSEPTVSQLADELQTLVCQFVICDIAPLGLAAAARAGLPSVLIENFTWDWIYAGYPDRKKDFQPWIDYLAGAFKLATYHVRTQPYCADTAADLVTRPVSRKQQKDRNLIRALLRISPSQKAILVTMGGIPDRLALANHEAANSDTVFIIPGGSESEQQQGNVLLLPHHHSFFHPDLVAACDAVVGKVGYSTISEVYWAGIPFAYISRPAFRESSPLVDYIKQNIFGFELTQGEFESNGWQQRVSQLLDLPIVKRTGENGADQIINYFASVGLL
jgi:hypothetical protein